MLIRSIVLCLTFQEEIKLYKLMAVSQTPLLCGVPQGSFFGPLLFLCYVNDMTISTSSECKLLICADDSAILFSHKDPGCI